MMNTYPHGNPAAALAQAAVRSASVMLTLPFDLAQNGYVQSVKAGLLEDSMLACAHYARDLSRSEQLALGPWARQR